MVNRKKILIADNDALNLDFFDLMLSKLGFVIEKAPDGQIVLDKISGAEMPDLILLGTVLPKISGWEILKVVKADPKTTAIPVLLLSEISDVKEIVEAFELGADDYIVKPFNFLVVLARIRATLRNNELVSQLSAREKRLELAEHLNAGIKDGIIKLQTEIEGLVTEVINEVDANEVPEHIKEKALTVKKMFSKIEKSINQTETEWESLKANEIGLPVLEKPIRNMVKL
ncbi:MAG: response regulator transcription factor [Spirochaetaceae bacterium]|jgi:DNA-binding response OmpR family regulator|nr:response regulator transcription factor [Spirochaetaceae bacterium]